MAADLAAPVAAAGVRAWVPTGHAWVSSGRPWVSTGRGWAAEDRDDGGRRGERERER